MSQSGSIRKRGDTFTAYWWTPCPGGVQHRTGQCLQPHRRQHSKGGFPTKGAARSHLTTVLAAVQAGIYSESVDKAMTLGVFLDEYWLPSVRTEATSAGTPRRASTLAGYAIAVDAWIKPHLGSEKLVRLTPATIERWLADLRSHGGKPGKDGVRGPISGRSCQVAYTVLRSALEHALRRGYVQRNVAAQVGRPGAARREMSAWSATEAQAFLAAAAKDRLYAAWVLLLARGLRRGELAGLQWSNVDLDAGYLRVVHTRVSIGGKVAASTPKTNAGRRSLPLDAGLVAVLRAHRRAQLEERLAWGEAWSDTGFVFTIEDGRPYHPESISQRFERLCKRSRVRMIRLHDLRHTAASLMLEDGTPVKVAAEMLGHANPAVTQQIYQHVLPGMAETAGERLSGRLLGGAQ